MNAIVQLKVKHSVQALVSCIAEITKQKKVLVNACLVEIGTLWVQIPDIFKNTEENIFRYVRHRSPLLFFVWK